MSGLMLISNTKLKNQMPPIIRLERAKKTMPKRRFFSSFNNKPYNFSTNY